MAFSRTPLISFPSNLTPLCLLNGSVSSSCSGSDIFASFRFQNSTSGYAVSFEDYTGGCSFSCRRHLTAIPSSIDFFSGSSDFSCRS
ncbi:hypothetical protein Patl1_14896 [Pistacia atlantica]|uniref:Uncharacterized protein n=1 Tax=Pistacia atlantica TaxID=434234 RepID=A0ACC1ASK9_9ROSI|nr:hypothetical protein Patl1_14896 [Pistacia atlantica]